MGDARQRGRAVLEPAFGVYPALVSNIVDPDGHGRVEVTLPGSSTSGAKSERMWARVATLMAGPKSGTWFVPSVNDEVLVCFEGGDPRRPYVVGSLWSRTNPPPESMDAAGANDLKVIRSTNGVKIALDDHDGQEALVLETPGGQRVTLSDAPPTIKAEDANGNSVTLEPAGITVTAAAKVTVNAATATISAGMLNVEAGMAEFSGVVKCDTLISNSVVSASYTPGVGNIS
jgi:uncharacterized protein involved in type VI secretion and phage assembly